MPECLFWLVDDLMSSTLRRDSIFTKRIIKLSLLSKPLGNYSNDGKLLFNLGVNNVYKMDNI